MKTKIAVLLSLLLVVATLFSSCAEESAQKQFTSGNFSITLDECFDMENIDRGDAAFVSPRLCIYYINDKNKYLGRHIENFDKYCELVAEMNSLAKGDVVTDGELVYVVYDDKVITSEYKVATFLFEVGGEFSRVEFVCEAAQLEARMEQILSYARTITIKENTQDSTAAAQ